MTSIAEAQEEKEASIDKKYDPTDTLDIQRRESAAARTVQRTYRGHRARRELKGLSLNPSTRWVEAIKEAQYRKLTNPQPRASNTQQASSPTSVRPTSAPHQKWRHAAKIASRAADDGEDGPSSSSTCTENETSEARREARRRKRFEEKQERIKSAKMMDLQYFLEMIDVKHRYGSNLRKYHAVWKNSNTRENFFYWLDYGDGRDLSLDICSRESLNRDQVRYLSREERMNYLVMVDEHGRLCWKRNGLRIDTTTEWKDSIHGIVPVADEAPSFSPIGGDEGGPARQTLSSSEASSSGNSADEPYGDSLDSANEDLKGARRFKKSKEVAPATMFQHLLVKPTKKKSKWIFVADTSNNLYVGMKQRGSFQHSSFLHGSRISAAGLIKIKDGQIRSIQPTSGHYRPPASNFRDFIRSLKSRKVDLSHINVPKSYAILYGVEGYGRMKQKKKKVAEELHNITHPGERKKKEEKGKDQSESAQKEREMLERQREEKRDSLGGRLGERMSKVMSLGKG